MNTKTYWDFADHERAAFTSADVETFLDLELMMKGVLKPQTPKLEPIQEVKLETITKYTVEYDGEFAAQKLAFAFDDAEAAAKLIALKPISIRADYQTGRDRFYMAPLGEAKIVAVELIRHEDYLAAVSALKKNAESKRRNEQLERDYKTAFAEVEKATKAIWDDWFQVTEQAARYKRVLATLDEYVKLSGGDRAIALGFLRKAFSDSEIKAAHEWNGLDVPDLSGPHVGAVAVDPVTDHNDTF